MKKILLTLGTLASVVAPVTAVIACDSTNGSQSAKKNNNGTEVNSVNQSIIANNVITKPSTIANNVIIKESTIANNAKTLVQNKFEYQGKGYPTYHDAYIQYIADIKKYVADDNHLAFDYKFDESANRPYSMTIMTYTHHADNEEAVVRQVPQWLGERDWNERHTISKIIVPSLITNTATTVVAQTNNFEYQGKGYPTYHAAFEAWLKEFVAAKITSVGWSLKVEQPDGWVSKYEITINENGKNKIHGTDTEEEIVENLPSWVFEYGWSDSHEITEAKGETVGPTVEAAAKQATTTTKVAETQAPTLSEDDNPFVGVKEDGLYMWDKTYDGKLWNGGTLKDGKEVTGTVRIGNQDGWALNPSVQLGKRDPSDSTLKEDAIYMVYDNDDSDGINMDNFTDTLFFEDTSVAMDDDVYKANHDVFGNVSVKGSFGSLAEYVAFKADPNHKYSGKINEYMGSQNNHVSSGQGYSTGTDFMDKMVSFYNQFKDTEPSVVNTLLKYYGLKTTLNMAGTFDDDNSILNHASRGFAPVFYTQPIFTYQKVFSNVIKITYHDQPGFQATAAHFRLKQADGKYQSIGSWSLGYKDWSSYYGHTEAKYVATKHE